MKSLSISISSVDLSEIAEYLEDVHRYGDYISSRCPNPAHEDRHPSFFLYKDYYRCSSCGFTGRTDHLLERLGKKLRVVQPKKDAPYNPNPFTGWQKQRSLTRTLKIAWETINHNPGMGNYITQDRGIEEPYRKALGIGYIDDWYTIPIRDRNGIIVSAVARKGRDNPSIAKYVLPQGTNPHLLYIPHWAKVRHADYLIITFGILDAVVLAILGYPAASTISGKQLSPISVEKFRIPIFILPDRREEQNGLVSAQRLDWRGHCLQIDWPEECKDVNDIWVRNRQLCRDMITGALGKHEIH